MKNLVELKPEEIRQNTFEMIGEDWMLITAEKDGKANTMTASSGGFGVMWEKNVAFVVVRPQRYTKEFMDASDTFSLTFFDDSYKEKLSYCGAVSGREEDKIAKSGLTLAHFGVTPYFEEGKMIIICKKLYRQHFEDACFIEEGMGDKCYPAHDFHYLFIAEIINVLQK